MRRRRRGPRLGKLRISWRWEIGAPLLVLGALIAGTTVGVRGGDVLFWGGVAVTAIGAAVFFSAPRGR
jgi:hypothetical protein